MGHEWKIEEPKLVKPPDGYRLLNEGESVVKGDVYQAWDGKWIECVSCHIIPKGLGAGSTPYARKIEPRYRPFASAAEFAPYRDKWISRSEMGVAKPGAWKPIGYSDEGIYPDSSLWRYADAFEHLKFEDGTPFGVLEDSQ